MNKTSHRGIIVWLLTGCFLIFVMVIIGGITRLTQSGLSMVEWKFTGSIPPLNEAEWSIQFEKYQHSPEYKLINSAFSLNDFKHIFWWEFIHRFIGRTIGFVFIIPFCWFLIRKKIPPGFFKKIFFLFGLGLCQGMLGWIMVKSGLNKIPHVSHYLLAAHLATAFATFGFTFWFALDLLFTENEIRKSRSLKRKTILLLFLVSLQIIYGAFVAGMKAGSLFSNFPKMGDHWIAPEVFSMQPWWKNALENAAGVQFIHRILAVLIVITVIVILVQSRKLFFPAGINIIIYVLCVTVLLQFILGVLTLLLHVPVVISSLHQIGAFFLFSTTILLFHRLYYLRNGISQHEQT
ncbi:MAG: COX15/CtaA family protein [Bacteroidota bacterium]|nr:COX15/CtaA family protein [Bacteroidota bacterium]